MSATVEQIYIANPSTVIANNDLIYLVQSPYTPGTDSAILGSDVKAMFAPATGSTLITTLGTITTGVWNGTRISEIYGGTNQNAYVLGDILYSSATNTLARLAGNTTATKNFLSQTGTGLVSAGPAWSTISASDIGSGAALTRVDDTNVTLTLGGTPTTALLAATSLTLGWTGTLSGTRGGTGVNNGASTITIGGSVTFSGAFTFAGTLTGNTSVTFPTSGTLATTAQIPTGAALTKTDDTNVTLTLGGSPTTALVNAASLTLGWTGQLAVARGGTGASTLTGLLTGNGTSAITATAITQFNVLTGGASNAPNSVAPSATSGIPLISQGAASQPVFGTAVVAGGGTGVTSFTAYAVICGGTTSTGALQSIAGVGTAGQVLTSNGAGALPTFQASTGKLVQRVYTEVTGSATGSTLIPSDNTIPQNTEGDEYMTLAITPGNASNILEITVTALVASTAVTTETVALFQDTTANALAAVGQVVPAAGFTQTITFTHTMTAGTTSSTTFKIRIGGGAVNTTTFNGSAGTQRYGGVCASSIIIREYTP